MINKVVLLGNLVKDPELKAIQSKSKYYTRVIIAINRNFKSSTGIKEADFVPVVFWGKKAEILCKYVKKGDSISISGTLRTSNYEDENGNKRYKIEVCAEEFNFINTKKVRDNIIDKTVVE